MKPTLIDLISSEDADIRDQPAVELAQSMPVPELLIQLKDLEEFRLSTSNLYHRVRAAVIQHAVYRFVLQESDSLPSDGRIDEHAYKDFLNRRFEESISQWLKLSDQNGLDRTTASCLAAG